ncbi:DUF1589 domain-containing protein [Rhodopirellula bahusiensis]|uniref:DUF1589 domain-containing protein n=1 Tax=Rhodopirellula bahusiensis TaxID=2014065 RepID=UPI0013046926
MSRKSSLRRSRKPRSKLASHVGETNPPKRLCERGCELGQVITWHQANALEQSEACRTVARRSPP